MSQLSLKCYTEGRAKSGLGVCPVLRVHFRRFSWFARRLFAMVGGFRWNWSVFWAAFATAVVALPAGARAGCTHPWVRTTGTASSLNDLALLSASDQTDKSANGFPAPAKRSGPCASGACSQPVGFPPTSTNPVSSRSELWRDDSVKPPLCSPIAVGFCLEQGCDGPRWSLSAIERPPRCHGIG